MASWLHWSRGLLQVTRARLSAARHSDALHLDGKGIAKVAGQHNGAREERHGLQQLLWGLSGGWRRGRGGRARAGRWERASRRAVASAGSAPGGGTCTLCNCSVRGQQPHMILKSSCLKKCNQWEWQQAIASVCPLLGRRCRRRPLRQGTQPAACDPAVALTRSAFRTASFCHRCFRPASTMAASCCEWLLREGLESRGGT